MKIIDMTCPKCGASLKPDLDKGSAVCEYCGHHILIEQEDTIEEIREKAQSKAYGYHRGKLRAEEEARASRKKKYHSKKIAAIVIGVIVLLYLITFIGMELSKPRVNPFDCIEVSFQGKDGEGEIVIDATNAVEGIDINRIDFDISKEDYLFQGENVSINATSQDYRLTEKTKIYVVEGLDEYLKDLENIPEEALEIIHMKAEAAQEYNLDGTKATDFFVDMKPVKLFLTTDGKQKNELYDVFEVHFLTDDGEKTFYVLSCFDNVVIRSGKQVSIDMSYGMYYGNLTQVQGPIFIMAYNSLEEIRVDILTSQESYMELKELDL
ncbi:MAG: hypothetical protein ACI4TB_07485 [Lachnospiraceae bacterium]